MNRTQPAGTAGTAGRAAVTVRRACREDLPALTHFFAGLSARTRYLRFFAAIAPTAAMLRSLSGGADNIDAVVATRDGAIIGHALAADRLEPGGITEIGVVVADAWQGQGVGSELVGALMAGARARGLGAIAMDVLPGNRRVVAMIASHWPAARVEHTADSLSVLVPLSDRQHAAVPGSPGLRSLARTPLA
jgi:acetyltransferase